MTFKHAGLAAASLLLLAAVLAGARSVRAQIEFAPVGTYWQRVPHDGQTLGDAGDQAPTDVAAGGPGFVAVGNDASGPVVQPVVWISTDGLEWRRVPAGTGAPDEAWRFEAVAAGPDAVVAVGTVGVDCEANFTLAIWGVCASSQPAVWWSVDGTSWNRVPHDDAVFPSGGDGAMRDVVATADGFYALGDGRDAEEWDSVVWSSSDGRTWQIAHTVDRPWPVSANSIADLGFGVVAFITEHVDMEVKPVGAVVRGGGYSLVTSSGDGPTPANQLVAVSSAGTGFADAGIGLASDYPTDGAGAVLTWSAAGGGFALGSLQGGDRTVHATRDGLAWETSTAAMSTRRRSFTASPRVLATSDGLVAIQFVARGTGLATLTWSSEDGAVWRPTGVDPPLLERVDAGFTGAGSVPGGVRAMAIDGDRAVAAGVDATGGDADAAFWFSSTGPLPDEAAGEPEPGTTYTTPSGCLITADAECPASDLDGADLSGLVAPGADLSLSSLTGTNLAGADLTGADLTGASLQGADLTGADLTGALLEAANLSGAMLDDAVLTAVDLKHTNFTGASLRDVEASSVDFGGFAPTVGAILAGADLTGAVLASADLTSVDLRGGILDGANLTGANLSGAQLGSAMLRGATISGGNFAEAGMAGADLTGVAAREATLTQADLRGAILRDADLSSTSFFGADLRAADLSGATLAATSFFEAILVDALLPADGLDAAEWGLTVCPDGFVTERSPSPSCEGHGA